MKKKRTKRERKGKRKIAIKNRREKKKNAKKAKRKKVYGNSIIPSMVVARSSNKLTFLARI